MTPASGSAYAYSGALDWRTGVAGMQKRVVTGLAKAAKRRWLPLDGVLLPLRRRDGPVALLTLEQTRVAPDSPVQMLPLGQGVRAADSAVVLTALAQTTLGAQAAATTRHGFTGHEMLDGMGLVHMNGRLYDPQLARFLSHDPVLAYPEESQDYNRYAYVWNGPLGAIDADGRAAIFLAFEDYRIDTGFGFRSPFLGHAGVILVQESTGVAHYWEYGR